MSSMANRDTPLADIFDPGKAAAVEQAITQTQDVSERMALLEAFLLDALAAATDVPALLAATLDRILETNGTVGIREMLDDKLQQRRSLERKFAQQVGLSPKQLCRAIRLQSILKTMLNEQKSLTEIGHANEFFDQAHFIKDFKDFTGVSPNAFYEDKRFALSTLLYRGK